MLLGRNLYKAHRLRRREIVALDVPHFCLEKGETVALVGPSGSGKSTLARVLLGLERAQGELFLHGISFAKVEKARLRRTLQILFQDPYASLDPRMTIAETLAEPLRIHRLLPKERERARLEELLAQVGLGPDALSRTPHAFSGGERQRIALARALAVEPQLLVADEPLSSLDPLTQREVLQLLQKLKREKGLTLLFISHDLEVVERFADRVVTMREGRIELMC